MHTGTAVCTPTVCSKKALVNGTRSQLRRLLSPGKTPHTQEERTFEPCSRADRTFGNKRRPQPHCSRTKSSQGRESPLPKSVSKNGSGVSILHCRGVTNASGEKPAIRGGCVCDLPAKVPRRRRTGHQHPPCEKSERKGARSSGQKVGCSAIIHPEARATVLAVGAAPAAGVSGDGSS